MTLLTERQAHRLIWNRTISNRGGAGHSMSNDVRLEGWNRLAKELLSHLGDILNEQTATTECNSTAFLEELLLAVDKDLAVKRPHGKHTCRKRRKTQGYWLQNSSNRLFDETPGRRHKHFKYFRRNLLAKLDVTNLANWLKEQRKRLTTKYPSGHM